MLQKLDIEIHVPTDFLSFKKCIIEGILPIMKRILESGEELPPTAVIMHPEGYIAMDLMPPLPFDWNEPRIRDITADMLKDFCHNIRAYAVGLFFDSYVRSVKDDELANSLGLSIEELLKKMQADPSFYEREVRKRIAPKEALHMVLESKYGSSAYVLFYDKKTTDDGKKQCVWGDEISINIENTPFSGRWADIIAPTNPSGN